MTSNVEDIVTKLNNNEASTEEQFQDLFLNLPLPLIKSVVFNIYPYFVRLQDEDIIKRRYHSLRTVIEKRERSGKTTGFWQILLLFAFDKRAILSLEDKVRDDLEALLDGALEGTQTSWTITYLYATYEYYGRMVEDDCKQPKKEFDNVPDLANVSIQKIKRLLEKNGLHLKAGILWQAYVDLLIAHKQYNEVFDAVEYLTQLPIPLTNFVATMKSKLEQLNDGKSEPAHTMQVEEGHDGNTGNSENGANTNEGMKTNGADLSLDTSVINHERRTEVLKLLENYVVPTLLKSREEFEMKRKELVKSPDAKAVQWLQKYFGAWTDYLDLLETSEQLQDTNFQVKSITMGTDLLCYEYKRLLVESQNLKVPNIIIYPIFDKLATRIMSISQLHRSFAGDQKWIIGFSEVLKDTVKNNLDFWITLISLQSLCVGPYFNFASTQDISPNVKHIIIEACAANGEWAKLPPLQFVTAEVNAEISQLGITDDSELKAKSKEVWEAKIKNYELLVDASDDKQIESLANLWFEYMETLGEDEDLEPFFEQALTYQPLKTIATIWMDYVSEVIDKDVNRGYELFQRALVFVKDQYKDQMWQELFEAVKQDTGLSLNELKELVSSLNKDAESADTKSESEPVTETVTPEKPKPTTTNTMVVDLTDDDDVVVAKKPVAPVPKPTAEVSPKPAVPHSAAAKKAPSPGKKQETSPPPAAFPKKRPAPTALSPKLGKRRKLVHENSQMSGFLQPQRPGSPPLNVNTPFRPLSPQGQGLPFGGQLNTFARPQMPMAAPNLNAGFNPLQLAMAPQLQQLLPAIQLQQLAQLMQSKQREQQAIQLQQQLQQLIVQLNMTPALAPILAPQIQLISQRLLSLQQPGVGTAPPVPGGQLPFHKPPIQQDKVKRLDFDTQFHLDVKYIQDLLPHFNIDDFKRKPEEFDLSVQIEPLENVMSMFLRQRIQSQQQQSEAANLPPLPDYTVQQISELVRNSTFREIIKQLQMRQSQLEMELAQRREQVLAAQAKERNTLIHMHNMRLQATPGRTDYVLKKNDAEMRSLEQSLKQQLLEFDQQCLRDFDKKIEEQQIILQHAGVPGFFPTNSQQQLAQQGQILEFIVQKIKETEKLLQNQSRAFEQPQSSYQQPRPQERIVTIQKNVQPVVQQTRDPRLPNMEITIPVGNIPPPQPPQLLDPLVLLQNQPDILAGLIQNNPAALLIATQGTPQQKQELLNQLQSNALLIAAQGTPQQQQDLMNQLIAQQQQQQNLGLPNLGMPPGQGMPPLPPLPMQNNNANFGMAPPTPPPMPPMGMPINGNFMSPQQQLMNQLQSLSNSLPQQIQPQQQQGFNNNDYNNNNNNMDSDYSNNNNNNNNNQFRGGYSQRGGGRPHSNRGRF